METLSVDIERKVRALVDAGYYSSEAEVTRNTGNTYSRIFNADILSMFGKVIRLSSEANQYHRECNTASNGRTREYHLP